MKKNKIKIIVAFLLGAIISCNITKTLAYTFKANEIPYTPSNSNWKVTNVKDAIDDLSTKGLNKKICTLIEGNSLEIGSKYECNPSLDGKTKYNFYIINISNDTVKLIMERNITDIVGNTRVMNMNTAMNYFRNGEGTNLNWKVDVDLPEAQDIADAVGNNGWNLSQKGESGWFCLSTLNQDYSSSPWCNDQSDKNYLYDYTVGCSERGCHNPLDSNYSEGYWTRDLVSRNANLAWVVSSNAVLGNTSSTSQVYGVRPVISISKSNMN